MSSSAPRHPHVAPAAPRTGPDRGCCWLLLLALLLGLCTPKKRMPCLPGGWPLLVLALPSVSA